MSKLFLSESKNDEVFCFGLTNIGLWQFYKPHSKISLHFHTKLQKLKIRQKNFAYDERNNTTGNNQDRFKNNILLKEELHRWVIWSWDWCQYYCRNRKKSWWRPQIWPVRSVAVTRHYNYDIKKNVNAFHPNRRMARGEHCDWLKNWSQISSGFKSGCFINTSKGIPRAP